MAKSKGVPWKDVKAELLKDEEFAKAVEEIDPEFEQLIKDIMDEHDETFKGLKDR